MSVSFRSGSTLAWEAELAALKEWVSPVFGRAESRRTASAFLDGLLSGVERMRWSPSGGQLAKLGSPIRKDEPDDGETEAVFSGFQGEGRP